MNHNALSTCPSKKRRTIPVLLGLAAFMVAVPTLAADAFLTQSPGANKLTGDCFVSGSEGQLELGLSLACASGTWHFGTVAVTHASHPGSAVDLSWRTVAPDDSRFCTIARSHNAQGDVMFATDWICGAGQHNLTNHPTFGGQVTLEVAALDLTPQDPPAMTSLSAEVYVD